MKIELFTVLLYLLCVVKALDKEKVNLANSDSCPISAFRDKYKDQLAIVCKPEIDENLDKCDLPTWTKVNTTGIYNISNSNKYRIWSSQTGQRRYLSVLNIHNLNSYDIGKYDCRLNCRTTSPSKTIAPGLVYGARICQPVSQHEQICSANIRTRDYNFCFEQFKDGTCSLSCKNDFHSDGFDCVRSAGDQCKEACLKQYYDNGLCKRGGNCPIPPKCQKKKCTTNVKYFSDAIVVNFIKTPVPIFATKTIPEKLSRALLTLVVLDTNRQKVYGDDLTFFYKVQKGYSKFGKQETFEEIVSYFALLASRGHLYSSIQSIRRTMNTQKSCQQNTKSYYNMIDWHSLQSISRNHSKSHSNFWQFDKWVLIAVGTGAFCFFILIVAAVVLCKTRQASRRNRTMNMHECSELERIRLAKGLGPGAEI